MTKQKSKLFIGQIGDNPQDCLKILEMIECDRCDQTCRGAVGNMLNCEGGGVCNAGKVRKYIQELEKIEKEYWKWMV